MRNSCLRGEGVDARILVDRERIVQGEAGPVESFGTRTDGSVPGTRRAQRARVRFILRTSTALGSPTRMVLVSFASCSPKIYMLYVSQSV